MKIKKQWDKRENIAIKATGQDQTREAGPKVMTAYKWRIACSHFLSVQCWMAHRAKTWVTILVCLTMPMVAQATPIPVATTASALTITAELLQADGISFIKNPKAIVSAQTSTNAITLATTVKALQESLGLAQTSASAISAHTTAADTGIAVSIAEGIRLGGKLSNESILASFMTAQSTLAAAFSPEPLFGRSAASTQGAAFGINLYKEEGVGLNNSSLNLVWDFDQFALWSTPASSLAYVRETITTVQVTQGGQFRFDEVGFLSYIENGVATTQAFDLPGSPVVSNWLASNLDWGVGTLTLASDAKPLAVSIPLLDAFNEGFENLALAIFSTHRELSYEAPPRAVIQVEEAAGHRVAGDESDPQIHWDPDNGVLSFDSIPIDLLDNRDTWGSSSREYLTDSLLGGFLEIDPLRYVGTFDGRQYFTGGDLRLVDGEENLVLTASVPTLVFEDALHAYQGFNGFAPLLMIGQNDASDSRWLADFLEHITVDSFYLPELFIGFDTMPIGDQSFSTPVSAFLSFAGPFSGTVPEPSVLWLLCGGLMLLVLWRAREDSFFKRPSGSADRLDSLLAPQRFMRCVSCHAITCNQQN